MRRVIPPAPLRRLSRAVLLAAALGACGRDAPAAPAEPWPLTLRQPGVVGYVTARLPPAESARLFEGLLGGAPQGLDDARPLVLLHLDAQAFGGSYALLLPVADEAAFMDSLARLPGMSSGPRGEYVLEPGIDSGLGQLVMLTSGLRGATSVMDVLAALQDMGPPRLSFHARVLDGTAVVAPTFEAGSACAEVLQATGGFAGDPRRAAVLSFDLERVRTVYAREIAAYEEQLRGLLGGARTAGLAGMFARLGHDGDADGASASPLGLDVNWEVLWALKEMLALGSLDAVQVQLDLPPDGSGSAGPLELLERLAAVQGASLRVRLAPGSPLLPLAESLRPAPELDGAALVLASDGPAFARACAEWLRPLAEVVKGEGPPCDRYVDELAEILGSFGGTLALLPLEDESWCLLADAGAARPDTLTRLGAWLAPLLATARVADAAGALTAREAPGGRTQLVDGEGEVRASVGRAGEVLWLRGGDADEPAAACAAFARALAGPAPTGAPALRLATPLVDAALRTGSGELLVELRRKDDG